MTVVPLIRFRQQPFADLMPMRRKSTKRLVRKDPPVRAPSPPPPPPPDQPSPRPGAQQFSTTDRTILEELKRNVAARESQFRVKGGCKHHSYSAKEAPYPRNYERLVIDQPRLICAAMYGKQSSACSCRAA
ncbi:hypothetical protein BV25DRAFT_1832575 [Artomyces pyxidatus]|uniref:Uncharacterized protein n=1 Tax=Artomyces pyxidatus TaxID=48021 RepID=A0ACB8SJQ9_9AGAM|nr:hypothetical protein BV25DRAFT_1832575 [Artomyces pyxidatus]